LTSSIVIHTLDILKTVYVNIFSCKDFDPDLAAAFTRDWFEAATCEPTFLTRR
jgi:S-adenosylmethionine/arginine decarboxylase-like enzyme